MPEVFVKCGSHRARQRLFSLVGTRPCYYSFDHPAKGGYYPIPDDQLAAARKIPGVTRTKHQAEMRRCWSGT